jgi:hypothetical protein
MLWFADVSRWTATRSALPTGSRSWARLSEPTLSANRAPRPADVAEAAEPPEPAESRPPWPALRFRPIGALMGPRRSPVVVIIGEGYSQ